MAATNASFNKPLENSVKDFRLKSLKKPFIGEILSIEGVKLCPLKTKPLTINLKNIANERRTNTSGPRPIISCNSISEKRFPMFAGSILIA